MKRAIFSFTLILFASRAGWAILPGPMKDFYTHRPGDTTAVVFGTREVPSAWLKKLELLAYRNADYLKQKDPARTVEVYADTVFPKALFARRSLVLMGTSRSNSLISEWRTIFPFILRDGRFNISGRKVYQADDLTLACIFPNPLNNDRYVFLLIGTDPTVQPSLAGWPGDDDYCVAQWPTFWGWYLNRGKFQKNSSSWSQELSAYDRAPYDTVTTFSLVYPHGRVWYPLRWEEDSLWDNPLSDRIRLLAALQDLFGDLERSLGLRVYGNIDFQFSDRYPDPYAYDPMGRVFLRAEPDKMDSLAFLAWGRPLARELFPCADAPLDWELFAHRYLMHQSYAKSAGKTPKQLRATGYGRAWAEILTTGDSTYLMLLSRLVDRGLSEKIGEALDSVTQQGRKYSFQMHDFTGVLGRIVKDTLVQRMARMPLRPSPYERPPAFSMGIANPGEFFLKEEVVVGDLAAKGAAAAAGLRKGDKILSVDGRPVERNRSRAYLAWLAKKKGQTLKLEIERKGVRRTLVIPVG